MDDDTQEDSFQHVNPNFGYSLDLDRAMGAVRIHEEKTGTRYDFLRQDPHFGAASEFPPETRAWPSIGKNNQFDRMRAPFASYFDDSPFIMDGITIWKPVFRSFSSISAENQVNCGWRGSSSPTREVGRQEEVWEHCQVRLGRKSRTSMPMQFFFIAASWQFIGTLWMRITYPDYQRCMSG